MSTGASHVGARKRKFAVKAKPCSGSTTGSLHGDLPSRMKVNLPELFAHPRKHGKSDDFIGTTEGDASELRSNDEIKPTLEKTGDEFEAELPSHDIVKAAESEREDNRPFVEEATISDSKDDAHVVEKSHSKDLTVSDIPNVEGQLRRMLQLYGLSNLGELINALGHWQTQDVLQRHETVTAFIQFIRNCTHCV
ncbi:hypothetical protein MRX96_049996 [Rhipicephalus microplus]|uniref:Uncharacterized protein n=1 Tax=Rhipicephalus microplus TaxID=6941 RepID=A0A9J6CX46_RHIMP|nr:hypothetical protein HPB51_028695 [Rhipicephalus microplus]